MKYQKRIIYKDGKPFEMVFDFEDQEKDKILQMFLFEASDFPTQIREQINLVLEGKEELVESSGNCCSWDFEPEETDIWNSFDDNEETNHIVVNTKELSTLIDEWIAARKAFKESFA